MSLVGLSTAGHWGGTSEIIINIFGELESEITETQLIGKIDVQKIIGVVKNAGG